VLKPLAAPARGFSLIEVMVTITLLVLLLGLAAPPFANWVRGAQVRTASDALQSGLRMAQGEAVRRNRQVVFFRTESTACDGTSVASATGNHWAIRTVPLLVGESAETLQCGVLREHTAAVTLSGPRALCFNSAGRQVANNDPGVGGAPCTLDANGVSTYELTAPQAERTLRVRVSLAGQVRMCLVGGSGPEACP